MVSAHRIKAEKSTNYKLFKYSVKLGSHCQLRQGNLVLQYIDAAIIPVIPAFLFCPVIPAFRPFQFSRSKCYFSAHRTVRHSLSVVKNNKISMFSQYMLYVCHSLRKNGWIINTVTACSPCTLYKFLVIRVN